MENTRIALIEIKKIIDYHLEGLDDFFTDKGKSDIKSIKKIIKGLNVGCECDAYNGFNCGCERRSRIEEKALFEINKLL